MFIFSAIYGARSRYFLQSLHLTIMRHITAIGPSRRCSDANTIMFEHSDTKVICSHWSISCMYRIQEMQIECFNCRICHCFVSSLQTILLGFGVLRTRCPQVLSTHEQRNGAWPRHIWRVSLDVWLTNRWKAICRYGVSAICIESHHLKLFGLFKLWLMVGVLDAFADICVFLKVLVCILRSLMAIKIFIDTMPWSFFASSSSEYKCILQPAASACLAFAISAAW